MERDQKKSPQGNGQAFSSVPEAGKMSQPASAGLHYSGRRADSPFLTDLFEPKRSPWTVRLQVAPPEEGQGPGMVDAVRIAVIKDGREVESAVLQSGLELNSNFVTMGPVALRVECSRDWSLDIEP
jgi:hypothetical protein